jgi:pilus assembly protein CpaB
MLTTVEWPTTSVPEGAFKDAKDVQDRVVKVGILRGDALQERKLAPTGTQGGLSAVIAEGKRAMTVRVNDVIGVAGFALPGNFVDIMVNTQNEGSASKDRDHAISKIVLERILVLAVAQEANRDETKPKVVNAVTLEVTPSQAEQLDLARSVGTLSLVLRNQVDPKPGATDGATKSTLLRDETPKEVAAAPSKPAEPRRAPVRVVAAVEPKNTQCVEVIRGTVKTNECF